MIKYNYTKRLSINKQYTSANLDGQPSLFPFLNFLFVNKTQPAMKVMTCMIFMVLLSLPVVAQKSKSQTDLVGTSYTLCIPSENQVYAPNQALSCFEYQLRENGQAPYVCSGLTA